VDLLLKSHSAGRAAPLYPCTPSGQDVVPTARTQPMRRDMPRAHADTTQKRQRQINFRVTDETYACLLADARRAELKLAAFCERVILKRKIEIAQTTLYRMDPALFAELRRIGNNLNQVAHAINTGLPPHTGYAAKALNDLLQLLLRDDLLHRRIEALRMKSEFDGSAPPETGVQLQGRLRVYPARRRQGDR